MGTFRSINANDYYLHLLLYQPYPYQESIANQLILQTHQQVWVIPNTVTMIKCLIQEQKLSPLDLSFSSWQECQRLIKQLLLLALKDEFSNSEASPLAKFARTLIATYPKI